MTVFDFTLQKEFLENSKRMYQEQLINTVGTSGRLMIGDHEEFISAVQKVDSIRILWRDVLTSKRIRYLVKTDAKLLSDVQNLPKVEEYLSKENLKLAILEDETAELLIDEEEPIYVTSTHEICHQSKVSSTKIFKNTQKKRSDPILQGTDQSSIWIERFAPLMRGSYEINLVDRHLLQQALTSKKGPGRFIDNLSKIPSLKQEGSKVNIFCETPQTPPINPNEIEDFIHQDLIKNKNIEFNFYIAGTHYATKKARRERSIMYRYGSSSYLQVFSKYAIEVIEADHFTEMFNDNFDRRGTVPKEVRFSVKEFTSKHESGLKQLKNAIEEASSRDHKTYSTIITINPSN